MSSSDLSRRESVPEGRKFQIQRRLCQLRLSLILIAIFIGVNLRQGVEQLLQPRDEIIELVFHIVVLLVDNR